MTPSVSPWESVFVSDRGAVRQVNEDSYLDAPDLGLWVIADGMGGHEAGQLASATVVHTLEGISSADSVEAMEASVRRSISQANRQLHEVSRNLYASKPVGSTVAILILRPGRACCLWAGDSRIYRLRNGRLERLTRDHSRTEELIEQGIITRAEAEEHPLANVITRAIGAAAHVVLDRQIEPVVPADTFLLCSDGLYRTVSEDEMEEKLGQSDCRQAAEELLALSLSRKPADNVTLGVVHTGGDDTIIARTPHEAR